MRRAAHPSGCARCGAGAGCAAIEYQSLSGCNSEPGIRVQVTPPQKRPRHSTRLRGVGFILPDSLNHCMGVIFLLLLLLHSPQTSQNVIDYLPYLLVFRVQVTPPQKRLRRRVSALAENDRKSG